jgi:hypothetical protein
LKGFPQLEQPSSTNIHYNQIISNSETKNSAVELELLTNPLPPNDFPINLPDFQFLQHYPNYYSVPTDCSAEIDWD